MGLPRWHNSKEPACPCRRPGFNLLEEEMAAHTSVLAWEIPWMEEPGGLQSMGSQRARHDGALTYLLLSHVSVSIS